MAKYNSTEISKKLIRDVNHIVNEGWGGMDNVARPQGNISTNSEDEFYRREGADMSLIYGPTRRPVRNKKEFVEQIADKYNLEYSQVYAEIRKLEKKGKPIDIDVLLSELQKLKAGH